MSHHVDGDRDGRKPLLLRAAHGLANGLRSFGPVRRVDARLQLAIGADPLAYPSPARRGKPINRFYIERFLEEFRHDVRGDCLEFQDDSYVRQFGQAVTKIDILHVDASEPRATIVADLTKPNSIPSDSFDCIVATQVLNMIFEPRPAVDEMRRILKPGGVLLVAVPHVCAYEPRARGLWRFTPAGLEELLGKSFAAKDLVIRTYGNSLTAAAQIRGLTAEDLPGSVFESHDERFAVEVCGRAVKNE